MEASTELIVFVSVGIIFVFLVTALIYSWSIEDDVAMFDELYSDDPDWCAANLQAPRIEINRGGEMLDDFLGLMQCEHKIISNSTFAWWAAFLGETDGGIVLAPARWHARADSRAAAIVRDGWVVVEG